MKTFDLQLSKVGEKTTKAITGSVRLVERLTRLKDSIKDNSMRKELRELAKAQIDIIKVSALNLREINQARRTKLRPHLQKEYRSLCNPPDAEGEWLLGDGLANKIKDMNELS